MIRVVIADDHHLIRQGLRDLLEKESDIRVVAEAKDGREVLETVRRVRTDVIVMDVEMPDINGIEATRRIRASFSEIRVVMLSMHSDPVLIRKALGQRRQGLRAQEISRRRVGQSDTHRLQGALRTNPGPWIMPNICRGSIPMAHRPGLLPREWRNPSTDRIGAIQSPDSRSNANQYKNRPKSSA